jgi:mRNA (2'-O-methyladenosine-N6-)-methyltransferase
MVLTRNQARMAKCKKGRLSKPKKVQKKKTKTKRIKKKPKKILKAKPKINKKKITKQIKKKNKKTRPRKTAKKIQIKEGFVKENKILNLTKVLPTNSTNLEEPMSNAVNTNLDKVSVENSNPEIKQNSRYSFRRRICKMKEDPSLFKESWGVSDIKDDLRFYKQERKKNPFWFRRRRRRSSGESFDGSGRSRRFSRRGNPNRRANRQVEQLEEEETDNEEKERIKNLHPCRYDMILLQKIANDHKYLNSMNKQIKCKIASLKKLFIFEQEEQLKKLNSNVPENSIPIYADVQNFNWNKLRNDQLDCGGRLFDVIMMDPPWQLSSSQPSRGVAIGYSSLSDDLISRIPIKTLQVEGFLFIWVINAKYGLALKLFEKWGYSLIDEIAWVKRTVTGKIAKGHGFYLQHSKETCLVGFKGNFDTFLRKKHSLENQNMLNEESKSQSLLGQNFKGFANDVIFSERRGQSQKPNEIYDIIEKIVPKGYYLEIFGRRNNLRSNWVTIGNEI